MCIRDSTNIVHFWCLFFFFIPGMDGGPSKHPLYNSFFGVNIYPFGGGYLMITSSIAYNIDQSLVCNIIDIPRNFISVAFNYNFKFSFWIYDTNGGTIGIGNKFIYIRLE